MWLDVLKEEPVRKADWGAHGEFKAISNSNIASERCEKKASYDVGAAA